MTPSWLAKLLRVPKFDFGNELSDGSKKMLLNAVEEALEEAKPLDDTRKLLGILSFEGSPEAKDLEDRKDKLLNLVTKFQQSPTESNITSDTKAAIKRSHDVLDQLRQADTPFKSEQIDEFKTSTDLVLSELGKAVRTFRSTAESKVQLALGVVRKEYAARVNEVSKRMKFSYACGKGERYRCANNASALIHVKVTADKEGPEPCWALLRGRMAFPGRVMAR